MSITKRLFASRIVTSAFIGFSIALFTLLTAPMVIDAACVQLQSYPPRTVCTDDNGVVTSDSGAVGTTAGSVNSGYISPSCVQLQTNPPQTVCTDGVSPPSSSTIGPVAFWKFDEESGTTVLDVSGNGNHGVLENGAGRYVGVTQGNKLSLDGVDDRVRVDTVSSNILNMNAFTVMAWIRPTEYGGIIMRKGNTDVARFNFGLRSDGVLYLRVGHSERTASWQTTNTLPLNTWSHVAVTYVYGTGNKPTIYLNGVAQVLRPSVENPGTYDSADPIGNPVADTPYIYIGNNHNLTNNSQAGSDGAFEGRMDLVRVYNSALSAAAIVSAKSPEPENTAYTPFPSIQQPDGTWIQPLSTATSNQASDSGLISSLQAQIQALLAQIAALRGNSAPQIAQQPMNTGTCPVINRVFTRGMSGNDVRELQRFLIARGHLGAGNDTGFFGPLTEAAVQRFQNQAGVLSSGSPEGNGYGVFGPQTRAALNAMCR